jgi:hypothetical protein
VQSHIVKLAAPNTISARWGVESLIEMLQRLLGGQPDAELKKVPPQMRRNIIIAVLALLWIAANTAHAYTFFRGSASNPYVKCMAERQGTENEDICDIYSKQRDRLEHDRLGVTLKSTLNATGLALVACFLIIGVRSRRRF